MTRWRYIFALIIIVALLLATFFLIIEIEPENFNEFNILLISIDTLRADHLGCYHYNKPTSPFIDQFSRDAVIFGRCMAQASSTLASHASILTSLIPAHHQAFFTRTQSLSEDIETMSEKLQKKKYQTVSFNDGGQIAAKFGIDQGFEIYECMGAKVKNHLLNFSRIVDKTISWLGKNSQEKFFLFLHTYETHHPYTPDKKYLEIFEPQYEGQLPLHISVDLIEKINKGEIRLEDIDKKHIINAYDAEIRSMDTSFGRLVEYLKRKNLYDKTMIIFTSDHGEEFGEHGTWATHSHTLFKDQLHIPLIIKMPQSDFANRRINHLVRSIDILPTVIELLGDEQDKNLEGISLCPLMKGKSPMKPIMVISQRDMLETYPPAYWSIMTRKWKCYDNRLYNLLKDPKELIDTSKENQGIKDNLIKIALKYMKRMQKRVPRKKVVLDKNLTEKLKSLGYLGE